MTFYVIGNGFDCHYGLKTSYFHFKKFLLDNGYGELVHRVDTLFSEDCGVEVFQSFQCPTFLLARSEKRKGEFEKVWKKMGKFPLLSGKSFSIGNRRKAPFAGGGSSRAA